MQLDTRLAALGRAQASLIVDDGTADLEFLIGEELRAGGIRESEATIQGGPAISLQKRAARALTLGLSELATATVANSPGEVCSLRITWSVAVEKGARCLKVKWHHEQNGQAGRVRSQPPLIELDHWIGRLEVSNDEKAGTYLISVPLD